MGRGDIKTKKGKISSGSYGVLRLRKKKQLAVVTKVKPAPKAKKATEKPAVEKPAVKKPAVKKAKKKAE